MKRALIVGAGGMGRAWGRNILANQGTELAGWVDIASGRAEEAAKEAGAQEAWTGTSLAEGILHSRPDFVVDVTVPEAHRDTVVQALEAGLPVIGEKPMADSMEAAGDMVRASKATGKLYMVSQSRRYLDGLVKNREALPQLGPLMGIYGQFFLGAHFGGFRDEMESPLVLDMAIHHFDMARAIIGLDPVSVYAEEFNPSWSWYKGDACANCLFTMEGGVRFSYSGSWCAEGNSVDWNGHWRTYSRDGWTYWTGGSHLEGMKVTARGGFMAEMEGIPFSGTHSGLLEGIEGSLAEFLDALESGATPQGEASDNIKSLAMVFASLKSSREGRRVEIAEIMPAL